MELRIQEEERIIRLKEEKRLEKLQLEKKKKRMMGIIESKEIPAKPAPDFKKIQDKE